MTQPLARDLIPALLAALADLPVVVLTGMRQTGKKEHPADEHEGPFRAPVRDA